ncbi:hypothetical protein MmTuc01_2576 [Methanosarcina mazei Tuc01]|uniref:Uncharacterized protein n=1 Tax=Methanosarcina mazei Tuc01 TaxID=1236903 RepID=M1QCB2_METMZ|nr:hypothetical protein MmTuc01_2576 [Methanosarcina mazei Tuc01]
MSISLTSGALPLTPKKSFYRVFLIFTIQDILLNIRRLNPP